MSKNYVYIATSLDGYIADKNGGVEWLDLIPNPDQSDMGFFDFIRNIDALVMGRNSFDTVVSFDVPWPYSVPVFVLSNSMTEIPEGYKDKASLIKGAPVEIVKQLNGEGYNNLYLDGGATIQGFLKEDLIDELIVTQIPILLGGGIPLYTEMDKSLEFELVKSEVLLGHMVKSHFSRRRE